MDEKGWTPCRHWLRLVPVPRAEHAPRCPPSLMLGHCQWRLAGRTASPPHCSVGAAICEPTSPFSTDSESNQSAPTFPPVMRGATKPPVQKGQSALTLDVDTLTDRIVCSVIKAHHQEIGYLH